MNMRWTTGIGICIAVSASQFAAAQNSVGNVFTGNAKAEILHSYSGSEPLPKPTQVVIQDFTTSGVVVTMDRHGRVNHLHHDVPTQDTLIRQVQDSFATALIGQFKKAGIESSNMSDASAVVGPALIIQGEFIAVNQGNRVRRFMVGFGRGASDIKTHLVVSLVENGNKTVLLDCNIKSQSDKSPGALVSLAPPASAVMLPVGVVGGALGAKGSTVQADAIRMAKLVGKQTEAVMAAQKWITKASAT